MLVQLFLTFFNLGLFTIGGGLAMIPLMQGLIVDRKKWMTEEEMVDCLAVCQTLPGVIAINMATYVGYRKRGIAGSIAATIGVILPSLIIIILVVELLQGIGDNSHVQGALIGIRAAATGLIAYAAWAVGRKVITGVFPFVIAALAAVAVFVLKLNALYVIVAGIVIGLIYYGIAKRKEPKTAESTGGEGKGGDGI